MVITYQRTLICWACALAGLILVSVLLRTQHVQLNLTDSMPIGFYRRVIVTQIHRGDFVSVCLPKRITEEGVHQGYIPTGHCLGGGIPVLKEVIAVPGDRVHVSNLFLTVNGTRYFAPYQQHDLRDKPTTRFITNGHYQASGYWLYGINDFLYSWDSRYYGGVPRHNIQGVYRLVFPF